MTKKLKGVKVTCFLCKEALGMAKITKYGIEGWCGTHALVVIDKRDYKITDGVYKYTGE